MLCSHVCCFDGELLLTSCTHDLLLGGESLKSVSRAPIGRVRARAAESSQWRVRISVLSFMCAASQMSDYSVGKVTLEM